MKEVSTRAVINNKSSHPDNMKKHVMVNEILRILRNCNEYIEWKDVATHITYFVKRLQYSGYNHEFRHHVVKKALSIYDKNKEHETENTIETGNEQNKTKKKKDKQKWYRKHKDIDGVMVVQPTLNSELKNEIQICADKNKMKLKIVEKVDNSLRKELQRSNPFKRQCCGREKCNNAK